MPPVVIGWERRRTCRVLHARLRSVSLALQTLAEHLAMPAQALGLLARPPFGGLLVGAAALQFEADLLPFVQIAQAGALDRGNMHEHVLRAVLGLNEAVALLGIEPLY